LISRAETSVPMSGAASPGIHPASLLTKLYALIAGADSRPFRGSRSPAENYKISS